VLVKRKASLDQIRKGLTTLGVLDILSQNIEIASKLFLRTTTNEVSARNFIDRVVFPPDVNHHYRQLFASVINTLSTEDLTHLVIFITGSTDVDEDLLISVEFKDAQSVFVSTCTFEMIIPIEATRSESLLKSTLIAASQNGKRSFNTM